MNLIEAARTGRRFKRPKWVSWWHGNVPSFLVNKDDLLATDWIVEDPKPKRRLYIVDDNFCITHTPLSHWTPLSRKEFEELFDG